jgi:hypothetical protein
MKRFLRRTLNPAHQAWLSLAGKRSFDFRFHRRPASLRARKARTAGSTAQDDRLIDRLIAAYQRSAANAATLGDSMWQAFFNDLHKPIHEALMSGHRDYIASVLRDPGSSDLFFGFDSLSRSLLGPGGMRVEDMHQHTLSLDGLGALAEAVGARRVENPEEYLAPRGRRPQQLDADTILAALDGAFGFHVPVPNPFRGEVGVASGRGVVTYRVPQAIYQAWRIRQLTRAVASPRVLEIGAGLGRTAFYARQFGIRDYTIIDIPITALAQGYFLGRVLGEDQVLLDGETGPGDAKVKILPPSALHASAARYDIAVNVDSFTEMDRTTARSYWKHIAEHADVLLSINHEANPFTVRELIVESGRESVASRAPYWMRRGYVEETVYFGESDPPFLRASR